MNTSKLRYAVEITGSNFFNKESMSFFGDSMDNYYVPIATVKIKDGENIHTCYELQRRKPVKGGLEESTFFDSTTFKRVFGEPA